MWLKINKLHIFYLFNHIIYIYLLLFSPLVMSDSLKTSWAAAHQASLSLIISQIAQVHVHCIGDAIQPSHPLMPSCPSTINLNQHQGLFH